MIVINYVANTLIGTTGALLVVGLGALTPVCVLISGVKAFAFGPSEPWSKLKLFCRYSLNTSCLPLVACVFIFLVRTLLTMAYPNGIG